MGENTPHKRIRYVDNDNDLCLSRCIWPTFFQNCRFFAFQEKIKKQIVDEAIIQQYKTLGYGKYLNKSGKCMTVVKHDTALTVVKSDLPK